MRLELGIVYLLRHINRFATIIHKYQDQKLGPAYSVLPQEWDPTIPTRSNSVIWLLGA